MAGRRAIGVLAGRVWDRFWTTNFLTAYRLFHDAPEYHQAVGYRQLEKREAARAMAGTQDDPILL